MPLLDSGNDLDALPIRGRCAAALPVARRWSLFVRLAFGVALLAAAACASAHAPGLSVADIDVEGERIAVQLGYARKSLATVVDVTAGGPPAVLVARVFEIRIDGGDALIPLHAEMAIDGADGVVLRAVYPRAPGQRLQIAATALGRMEYGHRQLVTVRSGDAEPFTAVLSAEHPRAVLVLDAAGPFASAGATLLRFISEGAHHVLIGPDHVLFIIAFLLPAVFRRVDGRWVAVSSVREALPAVLGVTTAFTIAHAITLAASVLGVATPPARWVEAAIAATVLLAALNNIYPVFAGRHVTLAAALGLVHGFGFAGALGAIGVRPGDVASTLAGFNIGVELAQLAIVLLLFPLAYAMRRTLAYEHGVVRGGSCVIALVATTWLVERSLDIELVPAIFG